jgi:outer membrane protein assembly factor BamB
MAAGLLVTIAVALATALAPGALGAGPVPPADAAQAQQILAATGVRGGLVVHLGCGDGKLTAALHAGDAYLVHGLSADAASVEKAREHIRSLGLYGPVSVEQWTDAARLPYADNLVNLLVISDSGLQIPETEVMRVLAPLGVAYVKAKDGSWTKTQKPWPKDIDEWTHFMHGPDNNAVAHDTRVGPPKYMQWVAEPLYCRSHEIDSSISALVSARGRLFYILDEGPTGIADQRLPEKWALVARDAFSGVLLWKRPLPNWGWPEWKKNQLAGKDWTKLVAQRVNFPAALPKRLVADGDRLYVTFGFHAPVTQVDAATGATLRTYAATENADEFVCCQGTLVICTRTNAGGPAKDSVMAVDAATGRILWKQDGLQVTPLSLAADGGRVVFDNRPEIVCLDLKTGKPLWRKAGQAAQAKKFRGPEGEAEGWQWHVSETLLIHDGVVLSLAGDLEAISLDTGKPLWKASTGPSGARYDLAPDLFVAGGLAWYGEGLKGLDPKTGTVMRNIDLMKLISVGHHPRCYPAKATDLYLIWHKQGAEFVDLRGAGRHMRNDWMRGPCRYGVLPCNGLLYAPSHQCKCYAGVKLNGFNALAAQMTPAAKNQPPAIRLEQGPAYGRIQPPPSDVRNAGDWPTFRGNASRSGSVKSAAPTNAAPLWQAELGGRLSQPVIADGRLLVASIDTHRVSCFDAKDGKPLWTFTAGGRVDSPPTVHNGAVLFGSADGWVYCLRAADGALAWRFRAAPEERRVVAMGELESAWPVHGSALVQNNVAYVAAGRSTFLDGGIFLYALDPATGKPLHEARLEGPYPDIVNDPGGSGHMDGATSEVLVGDGKCVYLRQHQFDGDLRQPRAEAAAKSGEKRDAGPHLMASSDLLDDSGFNRIGWTYGHTWPIPSNGQGQLLAFDATTTYGVQYFTKHEGQSQVYFPATNCIQLFAGAGPGEGDPAASPASKTKKRAAAPSQSGKWSVTVPVQVRAMVLAEKTLFIAGPPDLLDPKDPLAAFEGRAGGELWAVSAADGKTLGRWKLKSAPVFDGMAAAGGRLYLSTTDGKVTCMGTGQ